jgi:hypothetical protein
MGAEDMTTLNNLRLNVGEKRMEKLPPYRPSQVIKRVFAQQRGFRSGTTQTSPIGKRMRRVHRVTARRERIARWDA